MDKQQQAKLKTKAADYYRQVNGESELTTIYRKLVRFKNIETNHSLRKAYIKLVKERAKELGFKLPKFDERSLLSEAGQLASLYGAKLVPSADNEKIK